jgi:uncharacterized protein (TIGR00251 family)
MVSVHDSPGGVTLSVKIHPRAKKDAITGTLGGALKVSLTAPPIDGKANDACIEFFAKLLQVPRSSVTIASGRTSRGKLIRVSGLSAEEVRRRIGI